MPYSDLRGIPEENLGDGRTLYRALARQLTGDPANFNYILNEVLDHYLRVWVNEDHPSCKDYRDLELGFGKQPTKGAAGDSRTSDPVGHPIFPLLCRPDISPPTGRAGHVMGIIAVALRIQLDIYDSHGNWQFGSGLYPICKVYYSLVDGLFSSLVSDETGRDLIKFMLDVKNEIASEEPSQWDRLKVKELRWWWDAHRTELNKSHVNCWNEYDSTTTVRKGQFGTMHPSPPDVGVVPETPGSGNLFRLDHSEYTVYVQDPASNLSSRLPWSDPRTKDPARYSLWVKKKDGNSFKVQNQSGDLSPMYGDNAVKTQPPAIFSVFTVMVSRPNQIRSAVLLIEEALLLSPAQEIPVNFDLSSPTSSKAALRPYVSIDAEFKVVPNPRDHVYSTTEATKLKELNSSNDDELCTVLTIAVDRHLTCSFYLLDMLENAQEDTVTELEFFFKRVLFNEDLLKIWFNFQKDIYVMDNTIAHMYQKTERPEYMTEPYYGPPLPVKPVWKIRSPHFQKTRPAELMFSAEEDPECKFHAPTTYARNIACPCRYGNVDIEPIIGYVRSEIGLGEMDRNGTTHPDVVKRPWRENRKHFGYASALSFMLYGDWIYPILSWLKDAAHRYDTNEFYRSLGPGMETDIDKMGYNIGDVVGVALMFRFLTTTDDRSLLFDRLQNVTHLEFSQARRAIRRIPQTPFSLENRASNPGIPLVQDNPRSWSSDLTAIADKIPRKWHPGKKENHWTIDDVSYMAHEKRVEVADAQLQGHEPSAANFKEISQRARNTVAATLYDSCKFVLPGSLVNKFDIMERLTPPVVRKGHAHTTDLVEMIRNSVAGAPDGLLDQPEEPGCLVLSQNVKKAFTETSTAGSFESATDYFKRICNEAALTASTAEARIKLGKIKERTDKLTDPYRPDPRDIWDEWGEEHASRLSKTPIWNQPDSFKNRVFLSDDMRKQAIESRFVALDDRDSSDPGFDIVPEPEPAPAYMLPNPPARRQADTESRSAALPRAPPRPTGPPLSWQPRFGAARARHQSSLGRNRPVAPEAPGAPWSGKKIGSAAKAPGTAFAAPSRPSARQSMAVPSPTRPHPPRDPTIGSTRAPRLVPSVPFAHANSFNVLAGAAGDDEDDMDVEMGESSPFLTPPSKGKRKRVVDRDDEYEDDGDDGDDDDDGSPRKRRFGALRKMKGKGNA